jgi:hypothetical protein
MSETRAVEKSPSRAVHRPQAATIPLSLDDLFPFVDTTMLVAMTCGYVVFDK